MRSVRVEEGLHQLVDAELVLISCVSWAFLGQQTELMQLNYGLSDSVRTLWLQSVPGRWLSQGQIEDELENLYDF